MPFCLETKFCYPTIINSRNILTGTIKLKNTCNWADRSAAWGMSSDRMCHQSGCRVYEIIVITTNKAVISKLPHYMREITVGNQFGVCPAEVHIQR